MSMYFNSMFEFTYCFKVTVHLPKNSISFDWIGSQLKSIYSKIKLHFELWPSYAFQNSILANWFIKVADPCSKLNST